MDRNDFRTHIGVVIATIVFVTIPGLLIVGFDPPIFGILMLVGPILITVLTLLGRKYPGVNTG